jgi:hypothetical protein
MRRATTFALLGLLAGSLARADEPTPVKIRVGDALNVCKAGLVHCPVSSSLCDDTKVATVEGGPEGALLRGRSAGTTLCSVLGPGTAFRRVFRVTVEAGPSPQP